MKDNILINNKKIVLAILSYFQSGVRNIGVFLSLSLVLFSFSLYFKELNKYLLVFLHLVSLFLVILVTILSHFLHIDSILFKKDNDISLKYNNLYIIKWLKLIWGLKIVTIILVLIFLGIIIFDIKNLFIP